jgi:hypothetical protein
LLNHGRVVWQSVHDKRLGKPYIRFGLLDGTELTRPWPVPNARYPALWQTRSQYPYMNPTLTCKQEYVLPSGKSLRLKYGVLVHAGLADTRELERQWKKFAGASVQHARQAGQADRTPHEPGTYPEKTK